MGNGLFQSIAALQLFDLESLCSELMLNDSTGQTQAVQCKVSSRSEPGDSTLVGVSWLKGAIGGHTVNQNGRQ